MGILQRRPVVNRRFDPSLLYAECRRCGQPVLCVGNVDEVLLWLGVPTSTLDLDMDCLLLYESCPNCSPGEPVENPRLVRLGRRARRQTAN